MFNKIDFCQVCIHYDIGGNQCSKAPGRAIPKSRCADYEFHTHKDLCKYCSHNNYGRCTVLGHKCSVEPLLMNICADFENKAVMDKRMEYEKKERLCARCANQCKADGGMDYCEKFIDKEDAARTDNANMINALRKRCEEFMCGMVTDFPEIRMYTLSLSNPSSNMSKAPFIDFKFTVKVYKKD